MDDKELEDRIKKIESDLKKYATKLCYGNNVNPQDLFQDVYCRMWENKHMYKYDDSFRAWGLRIMHNLFIDTVKVENRYASLEPEHNDIDENYFKERLIKSKSHNLGPSDIEVRDMLNSLELLSNKDKRIIEMFLIEGYTQEEIGETFNMKPNNVKQRVFNAVRLVREDLKNKFNIDETYFSKDGLLEVQKKYRKKNTQLESTYRRRFNK